MGIDDERSRVRFNDDLRLPSWVDVGHQGKIATQSLVRVLAFLELAAIWLFDGFESMLQRRNEPEIGDALLQTDFVKNGVFVFLFAAPMFHLR